MDLNFIHIAQAATEAATHAAEAANVAAGAAAEVSHNEGVVGLFGLNLKLFIAQLVNFAIVLFVLWKWVFGPVTKGLKARTEKIENSLQTAEQIEKDKADFEVWKNEEMGKARKEASSIISQAKEDATAVKNDITEQAKHEKEKIIAQAQKEMGVEKEKVISEIKNEMAEMVVSAAEKVIKQKLDSTKDKDLIKESIKQASK